jgi:hypothetical protein
MLTRMVTMIRVVFLSRDDDRYWMVVLVPGAHDNPGGVRLNLGSGSDGSFACAGCVAAWPWPPAGWR